MTKHSLKRKNCRNNMSKKILTIINTKIDLVQDTLNTLVKKSENEVSVSPPETYQSELANSKESELVIPAASGIYEPKSPEGTPPPLSDVSSLTASDVSTTPEPETDVSTTAEPETDVSSTPEPETDVSTTTPTETSVPENDAFTTTTTETSVPETSVPETDASSEQKKGGKRRTHKRRNNNKNKSKNRRR